MVAIATLALPTTVMLFVLIRIAMGSVVVYGLFPFLVFPHMDVDSSDQWMSRVALMMLWMIVAGYITAASHLYSGVLLLVLMAVTAWVFHRQMQSRYLLTRGQRMSVGVYESLTGLEWSKDQVRHLKKQVVKWWRTKLQGHWTPLSYLFLAAVLVVLAGTAWIRFSADWHHAALFFSDASETLAWVKGIQVGSLFPNGIYPQGYYIVMAELATLTHANAIVFVKFFGAFIGTLMTASLMWSTYRFSGRAVPAIVAGVLYGLLPHLMPYDGVRQMSAEGQEFGNMWILPTAWLVFQSWVTRKPGYVVAASALLAVVGLSHPIALLDTTLAAVAATVGAWSVTGIAPRIMRRYVWMIPVAAAITVVPLAIPYVMGEHILGTATTFLVAKGNGGFPPIPGMVWISLGSVFALFVTKLLWYDELWEMGLPATAFLLLLFAEGIVQLPRVGINSLPLSVRAGEFLALSEALAIGLGAFAVQEAVEKMGVKRSLAALGSFAVSSLILGRLLMQHPPKPFVGYSMQSDAVIAEYVHIERTIPRLSWVAVSMGSYAYAVNQGYQYSPKFWVSHVSPQNLWPHFHVGRTSPYAVGQRDIFFFVPSRVYVPNVPGMSALKVQDARELQYLDEWVDAWEQRHGPMPVYFHNRALTIYRLQNLQNPT